MIATEPRMMLAVKLESTEGTVNAPIGSDANILAFDVAGWDPDLAQFMRRPIANDFSPYASIPGGRKASLTFKVELKGSGTAGTAPAIGKLIKMAGYGETVVAVTSVTYDPISVVIPTATADFFTLPESGNALRFRIKGARLSALQVIGKNGDAVMLQCTLAGVYDSVADATQLTASGLETTLPPALLSAAFAIQGYSAKVSGFTIDEGLRGVYREDISLAAGYLSYAITGRDPKLTCDPEQELVATHDFYGILLAGTLSTLSVVVGAAAGNICTITGPKLQYTSVKPGRRGELAIFNLEGALRRNSGNDHLKFAFT